MSVFYQIMILDIFLFIIGGWILYDTKKNPRSNSETSYNINFMNYLRGIGFIILATVFLLTLIFWKYG
jgi:hypothetical protein